MPYGSLRVRFNSASYDVLTWLVVEGISKQIIGERIYYCKKVLRQKRKEDIKSNYHNEQIDFNKYVLTFGVFFVVSQQPSGPWQRNHLSCLSVLFDTSQP